MSGLVVQSLTSLLQEAAAEPGRKNLAGNIKKLEALLVPDTLQRLTAEHGGVFAYLAFHPAGDSAVLDYLKAGTLADDSGKHVFCLFTLQLRAAVPRTIGPTAWDSLIEVDDTMQPASALVGSLFEPKQPPPLPGILFFGDLIHSQEVIYLSLADAPDAQAVRKQLRDVFTIAGSIAREAFASGKGTHSFADNFAVALKKKRLHYQRTEPKSVREWLVLAYQTAWDHRADVLTVTKFFV